MVLGILSQFESGLTIFSAEWGQSIHKLFLGRSGFGATSHDLTEFLVNVVGGLVKLLLKFYIINQIFLLKPFIQSFKIKDLEKLAQEFNPQQHWSSNVEIITKGKRE